MTVPVMARFPYIVSSRLCGPIAEPVQGVPETTGEMLLPRTICRMASSRSCRGGSLLRSMPLATLALRRAFCVSTTNATATSPNIVNSAKITNSKAPRGWEKRRMVMSTSFLPNCLLPKPVGRMKERRKAEG